MPLGVSDISMSPPARPISAVADLVRIDTGQGQSVIAVEIAGTWVGTLQFEASQDGGASWLSVPVFAFSTLQQASSATGNGNWLFIAGGFNAFRVRASAWTSGAATAQLTASTANAPLTFATCTTNPNVTIVNAASPAGPGTVAQAAVVGLDPYDRAVIYAKLQGAIGGVLDVYLQSSPDGGATWYDVCHYPQLAAAAAQIGYLISITRGETFNTNAPVVVNSANGTPVLAANTVVPHALGNALRAVFVAGAGTSAGAAQTIVAILST